MRLENMKYDSFALVRNEIREEMKIRNLAPEWELPKIIVTQSHENPVITKCLYYNVLNVNVK